MRTWAESAIVRTRPRATVRLAWTVLSSAQIMTRASLASFPLAKPRNSALARARSTVCALTAMSCQLVAKLPEAHAQNAVPAPAERGTVPVTLVAGRRGLVLGIRAEDDARYAWHCQDVCQLLLLPGRYQVGIVENGASSSRRITIREPERLVLTPPNRDARTLGSGLTIAGMVLGGLGSAAFSVRSRTSPTLRLCRGAGGRLP